LKYIVIEMSDTWTLFAKLINYGMDREMDVVDIRRNPHMGLWGNQMLGTSVGAGSPWPTYGGCG
jgi:hypothetical protein